MSRCPVFYPQGKPEAAQIPISPETAAFLGMDPAGSPTVDEALIAAVLSAGSYCRVNVTVTVGGKAAKAGIPVNGLKTITGGAYYTDSAGKVTGLTASANTTVSTENYLDLPSVGKSLSTPAQGTVSVTLELAAPVNNTVKTFTYNSSIMFSPYVTGVDVCCVGGGGGGGGATATSYPAVSAGGGGGGGHVVNRYGVSFVPNMSYPLVVGRGGAAGRVKNDWNTSSSSGGGTGGASSGLGVLAPGGGGGVKGENGSGAGGTGNGAGGKGCSDGANSVDGLIFGSSTYGGAGGGGGGGAYNRADAVRQQGGTPYGGDGASQGGRTVNHATEAGGLGGGGGGGCVAVLDNHDNTWALVFGNATSGYRGAVYVRYRVSV